MSVYQCGGVDYIYDILCDGDRSDHSEPSGRRSERVRSEAAGVLAQMTSPSLVLSTQADERRRASLTSNMSDLVPALTGTLAEFTVVK